MAEHIRFRTKSNGVTELTGQIKEIVENSGVRDGICVVYTTHTTGAVTLTSFWDPLGHEDIQDEIISRTMQCV